MRETFPDRFIYSEAFVKAGLDEIWKMWTTREGLNRFFGADSRIELKVGGLFEILFLLDNPVGQQGSEGMRILAIEPKSMLSFTWNAPPTMPTIREQRTVRSGPPKLDRYLRCKFC